MNDTQLLEQKSLVESFLAKGPRPLSSFSFVSLFAWCDFFDFEIKMVKERLCIFAHGDSGCFLYLPPLGERVDSSTIELVFAHMARGKAPQAVNRIENIPENLLLSFDPNRYNQYLKPAEYVYRKEDLKALHGNAYKSKRHDYNCFVSRQGACSFKPYQDEDLSACLALYDRWAAARAEANSDDIFRFMLKENRLVHERLLIHWRRLGLIVRVLKVKGETIGYTFGYPLDEMTFCVYAEITDLRITGAAAYIFRSFCADEQLKNFSRINTMDDFAMPNVARAKKAYHPSELIPSYAVSMLGLKGC
ncbi:MAG: DUF2156 domain-containing protein [Candidatus Omnitrophica bacterium]|nr:DUF2156 domain-containing protein [Candidatus Omnitrophota bacterium]